MVNYSLVEHYTRPVDANVILARINAAKAAGKEPEQADIEALAKQPTGWYAITQYDGIMTLDQFAEHIASHGSKLNKGDVQLSIVEVVSCLREQLLAGKKIQLGDLGSFSLAITNTKGGSELPGSYNPRTHVQSLRVVWDKGDKFGELKADAEFNLVMSRQVQSIMARAQKGTSNEEDIKYVERMLAKMKEGKPTTDDNGTGTGGGGGTTTPPQGGTNYD